MMPKVWNRRDPNVPADAVYIGRPTRWANMYKIGQDGTRAEVIIRYRTHVEAAPVFLARVRAELAGKDLVCWCAPLPCHGDVLLELANT